MSHLYFEPPRVVWGFLGLLTALDFLPGLGRPFLICGWLLIFVGGVLDLLMRLDERDERKARRER